jgi:hypothetical protein
MSLSKCNSCGGTYRSTLQDGSRYSHVCPSEEITHAVCDPKTGEATVPEKRTPRAVIRNENIAGRAKVGAEQIVSEGGGITVLPDENEATKEGTLTT